MTDLMVRDLTPRQIAANSLAHSNTNANHNVYLAQDPADLAAQAATLEALDSTKRPPLYSIPLSLKDCFDLRGYITTCGSRFYAEKLGIAQADSTVAARLRHDQTQVCVDHAGLGLEVTALDALCQVDFLGGRQ